ncbi:MAG: nuclear transport factor 2 family protein [Candidatus Riflebacteria bacterium]|nr:nuclear transport factor 2 family protein [Candidatus Riflebacteria bacterium]
MNLKNICQDYFVTFSSKNISKLEKLFDSQISLRDWNLNVHGRQKVLEANENIFRDCKSIMVEPLNLIQEGSTVVCELEITINNTPKIFVTDIITFNNDGKILSIRAYKG